MKLIDKDALVAEIERRNEKLIHTMNKIYYASNYNEWKSVAREYRSLISFLDTLEVKEVDLDFMLHEYWNLFPKITIDCLESAAMTKDEMINFAKHFFELGLKVSDKSHSVWHDASEDIGNNERILVLDEERRGCTTTRERLVRGYGEWGKGFCRWAKVDDLLKK